MIWKRLILSITIAIVVIVVLLDFGPLPSWLLILDSRQLRHLTAFEQLQMQQNMRITVLQALGGLAVISGAVVAWSQVRTANQTLSLSKSTRVTEVFAKAVEQLSSDGLATRLGGLYALDKLARDSEKERANIGAIISAFVRRMPDDPLAETAPDTQTAVTLLVSGLYAENINLRGARLRGVNLRSARLGSASLDGAILCGADLSGADLSNASMTGADLRMAQLHGANLRSAKLAEADLREVELSAYQLEGAIIDSTTRMPQAQLTS